MQLLGLRFAPGAGDPQGISHQQWHPPELELDPAQASPVLPVNRNLLLEEQ